MGTAKILYMRGFRLFAVYVRTEPVHTYIAKTPKRAIYTILYDTELVWVKMTQTNRFQPSYHFDNLIGAGTLSILLYKSVGHFDQLIKESVGAGQNVQHLFYSRSLPTHPKERSLYYARHQYD